MNISFLFGAGADSVYGICKGISFIEPLLLGAYGEERKEMLGDAVGAYRLLFPQSRKIYLQTIVSNQDKARNVFTPELVDKCIKYYNKEYEVEKLPVIREELDGYFGSWYKMITERCFQQKCCDQCKHDGENKRCGEKEYKFFLENAVFFDSLDEKMNDLRNTPLNNNGKRVINAYATIFIMIMRQLYDLPKDFSWKYPELFATLRDVQPKIDIETESYYKILREIADNSNAGRICVATTNYTEIAEKVLYNKKITYLHGNLNWFEDYKHLRVYDCKENEDYKQALAHMETLMPFILIPSGIKPIICTKQVESFHKFIDNLQQSDVLCVVGYKFNSEDNHINAIITEWLHNRGKKLVYFNYNRDVDFEKLEWADDIWNGKAITDLEKSNGDSKKVVEGFLKSNNKILNIIMAENNSSGNFGLFRETVRQLLSL